MRTIAHFFLHLGALGLVGMGILDSSFLFFPVGNDLLLIALAARHHNLVILYVLSAGVGSILGVALLDSVSRKIGTEELAKLVNKKQFDYVKARVSKRGAVMLILAAICPPPFPFTVVVAATSVFEYPRARFFGVIAAGRLIRFSILGYVAVHYGRSIIHFMRSTEFKIVIGGFAAFCMVMSVLSLLKWVRAAKSTPSREARKAA
jgi:membrane protein YqaA with SNARE-associated domain